MTNHESMSPLVLTGLDGSNPLAFLAALGTLHTVTVAQPEQTVEMCWTQLEGVWRPSLIGQSPDKEQFLDELCSALGMLSSEPFEIDTRLPFPATKFGEKAREARSTAQPRERRLADFIVAYGTECTTNNKEEFLDTQLRMVRSGDSAGHGMLHYALQIRKVTDREALRRALFSTWDYRDMGSSFRWDPREDQRHALRWDDPNSQKPVDGGIKLKGQAMMVLGANSLGLEALPLFPTAPRRRSVATTGFGSVDGHATFFTWPIWDVSANLDVVRSLLALGDLQTNVPSRSVLAARGIAEVYRSQRVAPNQYYKNFTPAWTP